MTTDPAYPLGWFLADPRATIRRRGIPSGLAEIRDHLEKLLHNPGLPKEHLGDPAPHTRLTTIGHDPKVSRTSRRHSEMPRRPMRTLASRWGATSFFLTGRGWPISQPGPVSR